VTNIQQLAVLPILFKLSVGPLAPFLLSCLKVAVLSSLFKPIRRRIRFPDLLASRTSCTIVAWKHFVEVMCDAKQEDWYDELHFQLTVFPRHDKRVIRVFEENEKKFFG